MIFASISAGKYLIIENDEVVANINQKKDWYGGYRGQRWSRTSYEILWKHFPERNTCYKALADIHEHLQFENYAGYGKVLKRNNANN